MQSEKCPLSVVREMVAAFARCQRSETSQEVDGIELGKCPTIHLEIAYSG